MSRREGPDLEAAPGRRWRPALAWTLWALTLLGIVAAVRLDHLLRRAGRPDLALPAFDVAYLVASPWGCS